MTTPTTERVREIAEEIGREIRKHLFISDNQGIRPPTAGLSWKAADIITASLIAAETRGAELMRERAAQAADLVATKHRDEARRCRGRAELERAASLEIYACGADETVTAIRALPSILPS